MNPSFGGSLAAVGLAPLLVRLGGWERERERVGSLQLAKETRPSRMRYGLHLLWLDLYGTSNCRLHQYSAALMFSQAVLSAPRMFQEPPVKVPKT